MRMSVVTIAALCGLMACSGSGTQPVQRYNFGIVQGRTQSQVAGSATLTSPVVARLARDPNGKYAFRWIDPLLPAKAYAQDVQVNGTAVPGQVVCATVGPTDPQPFSVCTNTDSAGKAWFSFHGGTTAGLHELPIHAQVGQQSIVTDTARVTVVAGPVSATFCTNTSTLKPSPDTIPVSAAPDAYGNGTPYRIVGDTIVHVRGDTVGTIAARTLTWTLPPNTQPFFGTLALRDSSGAVIGHIDYGMGSSADPRLSWKSYGAGVSAGCSAQP